MACELGASVVRAHNVPETMKALKNLRPYVILGLGSNVALVANPGEETEGKIANLEQAITGLCSIPDTQIIDISSYYESEPAYYEDQDTFVNAVVLARTGVPPKELLKYLHAIENSLGRTREIENGPRTLDLDIVDYQMYVGQTDELTLPHPRVCERDFVVKPSFCRTMCSPTARPLSPMARYTERQPSYKLATCAKRSFIGISFAGCLWAWDSREPHARLLHFEDFPAE